MADADYGYVGAGRGKEWVCTKNKAASKKMYLKTEYRRQINLLSSKQRWLEKEPDNSINNFEQNQKFNVKCINNQHL